MSDPMTPEVREWMKRTDAEPPDAQQTARQVMTRLPEVRQRRRWWPFPVFYRQPQSPTTTDTSDYQPSPIPAANGHTPTVIGRTQSMFSPVKAITAGALVFALGGVLLIAQPFDQQGSGVPGAETEAIAPTWVTGNVGWAPSCTGPDFEVDGAVRHQWNRECSPQTWTASDPRFSGQVVHRTNDDVHLAENRSPTISANANYLTNDDGGWACTSFALYGSSIQDTPGLTGMTATCVGQGGYEGLSAILIFDEAGVDNPFEGLIFSGDFPPMPEPPAVE